MNLKLIGRILAGVGGAAMLVGGGMGLGVWQYVISVPLIAVGLGLVFLGTKKA